MSPIVLFSPIVIFHVQEEFLKDVMQFLILRGHTRLIPQSGLVEFPDAILNGKRLDLYNLYKEVSELLTRTWFLRSKVFNWKNTRIENFSELVFSGGYKRWFSRW